MIPVFHWMWFTRSVHARGIGWLIVSAVYGSVSPQEDVHSFIITKEVFPTYSVCNRFTGDILRASISQYVNAFDFGFYMVLSSPFMIRERERERERELWRTLKYQIYFTSTENSEQFLSREVDHCHAETKLAIRDNLLPVQEYSGKSSHLGKRMIRTSH